MGVETTMNKKDIATIRKQFKLDNPKLEIKEIFNVYVQKESGDIYHYEAKPFTLLDREAQELFLANFKKVLTGSLDTKLFELKFRENMEESTQNILFEGLHEAETEDWIENMLEIVNKMYSHTVYEFDTVVTFIRAEYKKPTRARDLESEEGGDDEVYFSPLILCSLNKIDQPKRVLMFDYVEKEFKPNQDIDPIINLNSPLTGFLFPAFNDNAADVNHILYYSGKADHPDELFIEEVLNCEEILTAKEEKGTFELILKNVIGDETNTEVISNVYEEINRIVQENEESEEEDKEVPKLDSKDIERILTVSGVEDVNTEKVEHVLKMIVDDEKHELKASSLIPKTIKIKTKVANLSINPQDLKNVKYIMFQGKRCLLLEVDEDIEIEGLKLETNPI